MSAETLGLIADGSALAIYAMVAIWAAASNRHWFLRVAVVSGVLLVVLVLPAHDLLIRFTCLELVMVTGITIWKWYDRRRAAIPPRDDPSTRTQRQMSLASIFFLTIIVAVVSAVAARFQTVRLDQWLLNVILGVGGGWACLLAVWFVYSTRRWYIRLAVTVPGVFFLATLLAFLRPTIEISVSSWRAFLSWWPYYLKSAGIGQIGLILLLYSGRGSGWLVLAPGNVRPTDQDSSRFARFAFTVLLLGVLALPLYIFWHLMVPPAIPHVAMPKVNAFDGIIAASGEIDGYYVDPKAADRDALETALAERRAGLTQMRQWLDKECVVPMDYRDYMSYQSGDVLKLSRSLSIEARLAELDGRFGDRLQTQLDHLKLAEQLTRGAAHREWESATELFDIQSLLTTIEHLDAGQCRHLIEQLTAIDSAAEPLEKILRGSYIRNAYCYFWQQRAYQILEDLAGEPWYQKRLRAKHQTRQNMLRRVIVAVAIRAFFLEHNRLPERLADLDPESVNDAHVLDGIDWDRTTEGYTLHAKQPETEGFVIDPISFRMNAGAPTWFPPSTDASHLP